MARQLTGTTTNYLSVVTSPALVYPFSFSVRFKAPSYYVEHLMSYGKLISADDCEYIQIDPGATGFSARSGRNATYYGADLTLPLTPNRWYLAVAVFTSASERRIYLDNSTQTAVNTLTTVAPVLTTKPFTLGGIITNGGLYPPGSYGFDGEIADAAIWNTALTAADVDALAFSRPGDIKAANLKGWWKLGADGSLANSAGTYGPMVVTGTCPVTADPLYGDPLSVPKAYVPNEELTWVQKATHIWPLHPNNPLKADKGTIGLELVTGSVAVPAAMPDNTMEFHGGDPSTASYYKTAASIIFGDNPAVAGNQTPPTIGAVSFWFQTYAGPPAGGFSNRIFGPQVTVTSACALIQLSSFTPESLTGTVQFSSWWSTLPPQNTWIHVCLTHNGTHRRLFVNGVKVAEGTNVSTATMADLVYGLGCAVGGGPLSVALTGRMRLVSMINGAEWTDAEILEQAQRPYGYYKPDPTSVPPFYTPNEELSWVEKATHIWALHPSNPLKADKGGKTLELTGTGTPPTALPANTMEFHGGAEGAASFYQSIENVLCSVGGGVAFWIRPNAWGGGFNRLAGSTASYISLQLSYHNAGYIIPNFGEQYLAAAGLPVDEWIHIAITRDGADGTGRVYVNGVLVDAQGATAYGMTAQKFQIAQVLADVGGNLGFNGQMRLVALADVRWTDAEILEMYQRPYGYYIPDPTGVPDEYAPNADLAWVQKATHIWAVHPNDPLKADKGGAPLELVTGTAAVPAALSDNTMEFHGGSGANASYYRTLAAVRIGNATVPVRAALSCWVYLTAINNPRTRLMGSPQEFYTPHLGVHLGPAYPIAEMSARVTATESQIPLNVWTHFAATHDGTYLRFYINGAKIREQAVTTWGNVADIFSIGYVPYAPQTNSGLTGRLRLCAAVSEGFWTDAEILEQYQRPYGYYGPKPSFVGIEAEGGAFAMAGQAASLRVGRRLMAGTGVFTQTGLPASLRASRLLSSGVGVFELNKAPADPTSVPAVYTPNLALSWAQKATHIWALHPSDPLKADKGGMTLEVVNPAVPPVALPSPENTMQLHGGSHLSSAFYRTIGTFIWGDNPLVAGNQTPPMIGAMSCWVYFDSFQAGYSGLIGGSNNSGADEMTSAHLVANAGGQIIGECNYPAYGTSAPQPLNTWMHIALTNDAALFRVYVNGVIAVETANSSIAGAEWKFRVGSNVWVSAGPTNKVLQGRIRLAAVVLGATWTDAEILEQYQRPYGYYAGGGAQAGIAILRLARKLIGGTGIFALDGLPIDVRTTRILRAGGGEFVMTGQEAIFKLWVPVRGAGRIYYIAKDDRIVFVPADQSITEA